MIKFATKHKATILYSFCLALLLFVLKWLELKYVIFNYSIEIYIGFIALIFTSLGIWLALSLSKPKIETVIVEKEMIIDQKEEFKMDESNLLKLEISNRELEILNLISEGKSNQEIANTLFISLSTVKSHNQNLFEKLQVKRRTQAIVEAKTLKIIP